MEATKLLHWNSEIRGSSHFMTVRDDRLYILLGGLWVLDISDPSTPYEIASYDTRATRLDAVGNRVYLAGPEAELEVVDLYGLP